MPNKKISSPKTDYEPNNKLPCPTKNYVVQKQTTKQIIARRDQQKICSLKTDYETNNHLPYPTKKYVVRKQATKRIITCRAQQKNM